jgi:S-adenosylmethionine hydrolase
MTIISLTTDFRSHYLGIMYGVIKTIAPMAEVVELSSEIKPFNVTAGAYALYAAYRYFPKGTIHLVVVDPTVGSPRKAIALKTNNYFFVGPDNGVLIPAAAEDGILEVRELTNRSLFHKYVSSTFQGRDLFSPVGAYLANGGEFEEVGRKLEEYQSLVFFKVVDEGGGAAACEVLFVDRFGNLILSIKEKDIPLGDKSLVRVCGKAYIADRVNTYYKGKKGLLLLVGSDGFYELAVNSGSASELTEAGVGERMTITCCND